jgi:hypothetical protein
MAVTLGCRSVGAAAMAFSRSSICPRSRAGMDRRPFVASREKISAIPQVRH